MKVKNKLFSNTILYTVGEVVPRIISFLMMPIFTRFLSPADYGILSYTNSVISFIYILLEKNEDKQKVAGSITDTNHMNVNQ